MTAAIHDPTQMLAPYADVLGRDQVAYTNHVTRMLGVCDLLTASQPGERPSQQLEYVAAAVFHDLGIWTAGTFDYLEPSEALAADWLSGIGQQHLTSLVVTMIDQHHKLRSAGASDSPIEIFRRADLVDVSLGAIRFGIPFREYVALLRRFPDSGFHRRLIQLAAERTATHPLSPMPMLRW